MSVRLGVSKQADEIDRRSMQKPFTIEIARMGINRSLLRSIFVPSLLAYPSPSRVFSLKKNNGYYSFCTLRDCPHNRYGGEIALTGPFRIRTF